MFLTYHRVGRVSALPALAAIAAGVMVAGVAAFALVVVAGAACGVWLVRAVGRIGRGRAEVPAHDHDTIEGVVVDSTDVSG